MIKTISFGIISIDFTIRHLQCGTGTGSGPKFQVLPRPGPKFYFLPGPGPEKSDFADPYLLNIKEIPHKVLSYLPNSNT